MESDLSIMRDCECRLSGWRDEASDIEAELDRLNRRIITAHQEVYSLATYIDRYLVRINRLPEAIL